MDAGKITNSGMNTTNANRTLKKADADDAAQINTADSFVGSGSSLNSESIEEIKKKLLRKNYNPEIDMNPIWKVELPGYQDIFSGPVVGKDGKILVGTGRSNIFAFDPENGKQLWSFNCNGSWANIDSSSIGPDGTIYASDSKQHIFAVDPQNGRKKWSLALDDKMNGSPVVTPDGAVIVGDNIGKVHAFDSKGQKLWESKVEDKVSYQPLAPGDGRIYIESSGVLHALDEKTGRDLWKISNGGDNLFNGCTIAKDANDTIYAATSKKDELYAIDSKNGSIKWKSKAKMQAPLPKPTFDAKGETIFLNFYDARLIALNAKDGSIKWDLADKSNNSVRYPATPIFLPDGNMLYGLGTKKLYILDPANGSIKMEKNINININDPGLSTIKDDQIYLGGGYKLAAFKIPYKCDTDEQQQTGEPAPNPEIIKDGENVIVGGVKIPVRPNKPQAE